MLLNFYQICVVVGLVCAISLLFLIVDFLFFEFFER